MLRMYEFVCAFVLLAPSRAAPVLGLDLPRELIMDTNKAPYPIVNIIADMQSRNGESEKAWDS